MSTTRYSEDHEWISVDGDVGTVGITDYAQKALGDVVFVELPDVGAVFIKGDEAAVVESVKAASEIYAPVNGEVTEVNVTLNDDPSLVNQSADDAGWFFKIRMDDAGQLDELMTEDQYEEFVKDLD